MAGSIVAVPRLFYRMFLALPLLAKIFVLAVAAVAVIFAFNRLKDSAANNLRAARELHEEATELHESGNEEEAKVVFEKSNYHREKAYEQMQSKVQR